ncbi:non-specific lipid transfer protein GPI-anchored 16-like [Malania oleifera]|uniref:non-specific lipid transfer protein GPI-anchored 16-like n=1 Tax=Malania oleifera TaxID=397392 RepID=UPI0025AEB5AC|nr:non-specific lipid transfer protein GPI-anchored 16-like [Malania oleifera]
MAAGLFSPFLYLIAISATLVSLNGQINTPCTTSMISSFTPCLNFITGSTSNGSATPTADCCSTLRTLTSTSMDCACLVVTGNVPLQLPINRALAFSLPRACNMPGVPIQCKASATPLPAPGPVLLGPTLAPAASASLASKASASLAPALEPEAPSELTPASSPVGLEAPTATPGIRPVLNSPTPSASKPSYTTSSSSLLEFIVTLVFVNCIIFI